MFSPGSSLISSYNSHFVPFLNNIVPLFFSIEFWYNLDNLCFLFKIFFFYLRVLETERNRVIDGDFILADSLTKLLQWPRLEMTLCGQCQVTGSQSWALYTCTSAHCRSWHTITRGLTLGWSWSLKSYTLIWPERILSRVLKPLSQMPIPVYVFNKINRN